MATGDAAPPPPMISVAWALCAAQLLSGLALCYAARRIGSWLRRPRSAAPPALAPQLVIAATGPLPGLAALRDALAAQTVVPASLTFAVEAADDPAFARIAAVFGGFPVPVVTVVAGLASAGSQKSRNLVAALRTLDAARPVVLADVDILPAADWLATLLRPIAAGRAAIVTGYRWPVPLDARLPTLLATWIDQAIAALPKRVGSQLIWGGSVAIAAGVIGRIGLIDRLEAQMSDDLYLAEAARGHGLRVVFATGALVGTPTALGWRSLFGFGRRQYQMIRLYAPRVFLAALAVTLFNLVGTALPLILAARSRWGGIAYASIVAVGLLTTRSRSRLGDAIGHPADRRIARRLALLGVVLPLVHAVHLAMIVAAVRVRTIRWGRYRYRIEGRRVVAVVRA